MPDTRPGIFLDEEGICSGCHGYHDKTTTIDWRDRALKFEQLISWAKNKSTTYDCIIPVSGGKDSWYQVIKAKEANLKVLCVTWKTPGRTDIGQKNLDALVAKLNVDHIDFTIDPEVEKKFMIASFERKGATGIPMHLAIFSIPMRLANQFKIPLVIWGENPQLEYGQPTDIEKDTILDRDWNEKNGGYFLDKIKPQDMTEYGFDLNDLKPYLYPTDEEVRKVGVTGVFLGSYIKWDIFKQLELVKTLGFSENEENKEGTYNKWENLDVYFTVFHDYFKFLKYGFGRTTDHVSIEMRYGRMTRERGIELVKEYEGKIPRKYLKEFLEAAEISENKFHEICDKFTNKELFQTDQDGNLLKDKDGNLTLKNEIL